MGKYFEQEYSERIMKSEVCAKGYFDFEKLSYSRQQFLDCRIEEEKEEIIFYYNIQGKNSFLKLREEKKADRLKALLEIKKLGEIFHDYHFELIPENLYYDRNYRIFVKSRDLFDRGISGEHEQFLIQYKALIGHVMQKKYSYDDYLKGGSDLYQKNSLLKTVADAESLEELCGLLEEEYRRLHDIATNKKVEVNKSWYRLSSWCMAAAIVLLAAAGVFLLYLSMVLLPRKNAMMDASASYLDGNYVKVIDDLQDVDMKYLDKHQKYILAVSYVRSESLTPEQKENILQTITVDGEEKIKDYWIYLGRLNTLEAENVAMQRSDDELLLYAYMTEKAILEKNTEISGEEKASRLSELEKKIEELAEQYEEQTDENKAGE